MLFLFFSYSHFYGYPFRFIYIQITLTKGTQNMTQPNTKLFLSKSILSSQFLRCLQYQLLNKLPLPRDSTAINVFNVKKTTSLISQFSNHVNNTLKLYYCKLFCFARIFKNGYLKETLVAVEFENSLLQELKTFLILNFKM